MQGFIISIILVFIATLVIITRIKIVPQATTYVIERFGAFHKVWKTGFHFLFPFIDKIRSKVDMRERVMDVTPQPVITKDNVTVMIDAMLFFQVTDPKLLIYGVAAYESAIINLAVTTLRNFAGNTELDQLLVAREDINMLVTASLDAATDRWGTKIIRVEVQNINPPKTIIEAMEKQMRAERERREMILLAEGQKRSAILNAEGQKESEILMAEAEKAATILHADAERERKILEAKGESESVLLVQKALADSIRVLKEADPSGELVLAIKGFEALSQIGSAPSAKIIIPSNLQGVAALTGSIKELLK
jgi:regulator of protease activity HflC (stomatin/prohibitin superfamily)